MKEKIRSTYTYNYSQYGMKILTMRNDTSSVTYNFKIYTYFTTFKWVDKFYNCLDPLHPFKITTVLKPPLFFKPGWFPNYSQNPALLPKPYSLKNLNSKLWARQATSSLLFAPYQSLFSKYRTHISIIHFI